ncbi:MAG: dihydrolipoamide acetyltransferase family protein [Roseiflexaceae bacterium]|nr:dihydrolipoamide acetyltransferase family protein [Roseiflexaceae bacterium]
MATAVILPKLGNSVESSIIVRWMKQAGDAVSAGEPICEIETDKTTVEVVSPAAGVLLAQLFQVGDDVPVMTSIALVGAAGEDVANLVPSIALPTNTSTPPAATAQSQISTPTPELPSTVGISPRARKLAEHEQLDTIGIQGSGPSGRVIERDIRAALDVRPKLTPLARAMVEKGGFVAPSQGSGADRRVTARDLLAPVQAEMPTGAIPTSNTTDSAETQSNLDETIPVVGVRRIIAERMRTSLQTTAQLTLHSSADARQLQAYRKRLKESAENLGLRGITINDLILFAVSRTLLDHRSLNAIFRDTTITQYRHIHLGVAVDTPRGLLVPIIHNADTLSLRALSTEAARLAKLSQSGKASVEELSGGSFTVTNLGSMGIESFTPILNAPQVAILGVGSINLKPIDRDGEVVFVPHINLALTIDHQVIDGAPAARFLQALARNLAELDVLVAV